MVGDDAVVDLSEGGSHRSKAKVIDERNEQQWAEDGSLGHLALYGGDEDIAKLVWIARALYTDLG